MTTQTTHCWYELFKKETYLNKRLSKFDEEIIELTIFNYFIKICKLELKIGATMVIFLELRVSNF